MAGQPGFQSIAVFGVGGVGGLIAARLALAGWTPMLVARPAGAATLTANGLTLQTATATHTLRLPALSAEGDLAPVDLLIVALKAQDWPAALPALQRLCGPATTLLAIQNGIPWWWFLGQPGRFANRPVEAVDPGGTVAASLGITPVLGGVLYGGATRLAADRIAWNGHLRVVLGEPSGAMSGRLAAVETLLAGAGIEVTATPDIRRAIWEKLGGNAVQNPLSVLSGAGIGATLEDVDLRGVARAMLHEVHAVAEAHGTAKPFDVEARLNPSAAMRDFRTSMVQDYEAGRPLELGAILDAVNELGGLADLPMPVCRAVAAIVRQQWRKRWQAGPRPASRPPSAAPAGGQVSA
jgi:2-dehydropantoate 2-reductase